MPSLKDRLSTIAPLIAFGSFVAFLLIEGITSSIPGWKLRNQYERALTFYADANDNGRIEPAEESTFVANFVADVRKKPGYEDFSLRTGSISVNNPDAGKLLKLLREYRPVPTF